MTEETAIRLACLFGGLSVGACMGVFVCALAVAAGRADQAMEAALSEGDKLAERAESGHELIEHDDPRWTGALM